MKHILKILIILFIGVLDSCSDPELDNPLDKKADSYIGNDLSSSSEEQFSSSSEELSSSSGEGGESSSSGEEEVSSSSEDSDNSSSSSIPVSSSSSEVVLSSSSTPSSSSSEDGDSSSSSEIKICRKDGTEDTGKNYNMTTHFCDTRDGNIYKFVTIGSNYNAQTWMAENLNYWGEDSNIGKCGIGTMLESSKDTGENCKKYGRLYHWAEAIGSSNIDCNSQLCETYIKNNPQGICPEGWRLPTKDKWVTLIESVNGTSCEYNSSNGCPNAAKFLKANVEGGWNGEDRFGFAALPGGYGERSVTFKNVGTEGLWWTATEKSNNTADFFIMSSGKDLVATNLMDGQNKTNAYSVRCVKDSN